MNLHPFRAPVSRRLLLKTGVTLAAGFAAPSLFANATEAQRMRAIPSTGEQLPMMGLGTYQTFDVGTGASARARVAEVLRDFVADGGKVIDSSPMYGRAETVVGDLAAQVGVANKLFYATKVWTRGREAGIRQMEESMVRMRVKVMDLMQIHNLVDWQTQIRTLYDWKASGKLRYIGITHYTPHAFDEMQQIMRTEHIDFVQVPYNILERTAEQHLLPLATERDIAVLVNEPFEKGHLFRQVRGKSLPSFAKDFDCTSWAQYFLKYIMGDPAVTCVIPATSDPKHLADNMGSGRGRLPDAAQRRQMVDYLRKL